MAALVRIKRRLDEDPLETLILNCKRRKKGTTDTTKSEELSTLFQLAGTSKENENIENLLKKHRVSNAEDLKQQFKKHDVKISERLRSEIKKTSRNNRYRVVNYFRKTLEHEEDSEEAGISNLTEVTVFDLENDCVKNESTNKGEENQPKYVYDFYYTSCDDFGEADMEDYVSVYALNDPIVYGSVKDNGLDELDSECESEDSNAENYWKNDYPDEDDIESVNEDDMIKAVKNLTISDDCISSDSGEEDLIYSKEEEDYQVLEQDIDEEDELRYGKRYAKFKAKYTKLDTGGLSNDLYYGDIDEEEYYY